jgi:hypothetical protein
MSSLPQQLIDAGCLGIKEVRRAEEKHFSKCWSLAEWYDSDERLYSGWIASHSIAARLWIKKNFPEAIIFHCYADNPNPGDVAVAIR